MARLIDVFISYLKAENVDTMFGIVGGLVYPLFDAVELDPDIKVVMTKHEQGAAFMADGYARASRRLGVCAATGGPGSTNLLTGVACAFADGVPMLVITGQAALHALGKGAAQETGREDIDIVAMFRPITKYSAMITNATSFTHHVRRALRSAMNGRRGPVHLNVPVDLWYQEVKEEWFQPETYRPTVHAFDRQAVQRTADLLVAAKRPVLLAGSGVISAGAEQHLAELANLIGARVATSPRGKSSFPGNDPRSLGVLGTAGHREARDVVLGPLVDVLFTVGTSLSETSTLNWNVKLRPTNALIQLDIDVEKIGRNYPVDVALAGDAQTILVELLYQIHRKIREGATVMSEWSNWKQQPKDASWYLNGEARSSVQKPLRPEAWRAELQDVLPDNAIVFSDIGGHMLFNIHHLEFNRGQRFLINMGFGSMGHGTVAPIGAAMSRPDAVVVAIVGDGCFAMNGMELLTAVEHQTKVIWLVENNQMHSITWHASKVLSGGRGLEMAKMKTTFEIAAIARAMGLAASVVDRPGQLKEAFVEALERRGPSLLDVRVDAEAAPPVGDRAQTLAGFIDR